MDDTTIEFIRKARHIRPGRLLLDECPTIRTGTVSVLMQAYSDQENAKKDERIERLEEHLRSDSSEADRVAIEYEGKIKELETALIISKSLSKASLELKRESEAKLDEIVSGLDDLVELSETQGKYGSEVKWYSNWERMKALLTAAKSDQTK